MLKIFNKPALTRKQRFSRAVIVGIVVSIIGIILRVALVKMFYVDFSLLYVGLGFLIGYSIQYFGKGVQTQFSILAAILTFICIFVSDFIIYGNLSYILNLISGYGVNSLLSLAYRGVAIYLAFKYARVV